MPKRITPADATPIRVVVVTMDGHLSRAASRAQARLKGNFPGLVTRRSFRGRMGHRRRGARPLQGRYRPRRHRDRHDAVPRRSRPRRDAGAGRAPQRLRRHGLLHVGGRGREADAGRQVRHERRGAGRHRMAEEAARQSQGFKPRRQGRNEDAAAVAKAAALHSRHRAGHARLLPDACNTGWRGPSRTSPT